MSNSCLETLLKLFGTCNYNLNFDEYFNIENIEKIIYSNNFMTKKKFYHEIIKLPRGGPISGSLSNFYLVSLE